MHFPVIIRHCTDSDFTGIVPLLRQLWPNQYFDITKLESILKNNRTSGNHCYHCAELDHRLIGSASLLIKRNLRVRGNLGHIEELIVIRSTVDALSAVHC